MGRDVLCNGAHQPDNAVFRRAVRRHRRCAHLSGGGGDHHYAPPARVDHVGDESAGELERGVEVHGHRGTPAVAVLIPNRPIVPAAAACVVDENRRPGRRGRGPTRSRRGSPPACRSNPVVARCRARQRARRATGRCARPRPPGVPHAPVPMRSRARCLGSRRSRGRRAHSRPAARVDDGLEASLVAHRTERLFDSGQPHLVRDELLEP